MIKDTIYGDIEFNSLCSKFANVPEFKRLEYIKNTFSHPIYISLNVSRKEHSIGVMHLASLLAKQLNATPKQIELLSLAGLYHDIGHVATSHLLDGLLIQKGIPDHEHRSISILEKVNNRLQILSKDDLKIVSNMILGIGDSWLYEIIHNNGKNAHDVDRLDYLNRDGYHIGIFKLNAMEELKYYYIDSENHLNMNKNSYQLIWDIRTFMFVNVYHSKENEKQNEILKPILMNFIKNIDFNDFDWLRLTDSWISAKAKF